MKRKLNTMQLLERLWQHDAPLRYVEAVDPRSGALVEVAGCDRLSMREGAPTLPKRDAPHNDYRGVIMPHVPEPITTTPDAPRAGRCPFIDEDHGRCGLDAHEGVQVHHQFFTDRRTGANVSAAEFHTVTLAEASTTPWLARFQADDAGGLFEALRWWRANGGAPPPTVLHISEKWHALMVEDGSLTELLAASPTIATVLPTAELDDDKPSHGDGHGLILAPAEAIDVRLSFMVHSGGSR